MAGQLAALYGTEKDKVNCPFYFKIGACRHGDQCSRQHNKPDFSETLILTNMYKNPALEIKDDGMPVELSDKEVQQHFEDFFEEVYAEMAKYGKIVDMVVCDNLADHLIGNVYVKFDDEEDALDALEMTHNRWYDGRQVHAEFSPCTDFREARCKQYEKGSCDRGGWCNFMHLKDINDDLSYKLLKKRKRDRLEARGGMGGGGYRGGGGGYRGDRGGHRGRDRYDPYRSRDRYRGRDDRRRDDYHRRHDRHDRYERHDRHEREERHGREERPPAAASASAGADGGGAPRTSGVMNPQRAALLGRK